MSRIKCNATYDNNGTGEIGLVSPTPDRALRDVTTSNATYLQNRLD